jgi:hypothetical protein
LSEVIFEDGSRPLDTCEGYGVAYQHVTDTIVCEV